MPAPGLEIRNLRQAAPSVGGESTHSIASTALTEKNLEGLPIAQKVGVKKFRYFDWEGREITRDEASQIAGGNIWYQDEADPRKGCVRRRGRFAGEDDARSHLSGSKAGCSTDIANHADFDGIDGLSDLPEADEEHEERQQTVEKDDTSDQKREAQRFCSISWWFPILLLVFIVSVSLHFTPQAASSVGLLPSPEPQLSKLEALSCSSGEVGCMRHSQAQSIMGRTGSMAMSQSLLNLLAKDDMVTDQKEMMRFLAGPIQQTYDDALPVKNTKIMAAAEIDRILASREVSDILGDGTKKEQRQEFHRIVQLLHPDKGFVSVDDPRAKQALRLVFAARRATSGGEAESNGGGRDRWNPRFPRGWGYPWPWN